MRWRPEMWVHALQVNHQQPALGLPAIGIRPLVLIQAVSFFIPYQSHGNVAPGDSKGIQFKGSVCVSFIAEVSPRFSLDRLHVRQAARKPQYNALGLWHLFCCPEISLEKRAGTRGTECPVC